MIDVRVASFTRRLRPESLADVGVGSVIFGAASGEDRAGVVIGPLLAGGAVGSYCLKAIDDAVYEADGLDVTINLFESESIASFVQGVHGLIAIDLTSLEHRVWAPLVKTLVALDREFVALYAEPKDYRRSDDLPGTVYDLSSSRGIEPLPGFARLSRASVGGAAFAPLLGFEGARLKHIFDQEDVDVAQTRPVVGSPGFRMEYPAYSYAANRDVLELGRMDQRVEFARASCPFEAYWAIKRIHLLSGGGHLRVAPIGTKPHALGAVLYATLNEPDVELIYDHPVPSAGRTSGSRNVYVFEVSAFLRGEATNGT